VAGREGLVSAAPEPGKGPPPNGPWAALAVSMQLAASIGLGVAAGWWLDRHMDWAPWGVIAGVILGTTVGIYLVIKELA
jgi:F0F1-type ATP synthase assembly protein I